MLRTTPNSTFNRMAGQNQLEKLVVLRVPACYNLQIHIHPFCTPRKCRQKCPDILFAEILLKLGSVENFNQLCKCSKRNEDPSFPERQIESLARFRTGKE